MIYEKLEDLKYDMPRKERILAFGLEPWQLGVLDEIVKLITIKDHEVTIFLADEFTDIFAINHFMAFLNFAALNEADKQTFMDYWQEGIEDNPNEEELKKSDFDTKMPLTFILHYGRNKPDKFKGLFFDNDIFVDEKRLRLSLLQEIKNLEGKGRMANGKGSDRLKRVLTLYRQLVYQGWLTKDSADKVCVHVYRLRDKPLSLRMFQRDMQLIREIDPNVYYDKDSKQFVLKGIKRGVMDVDG